MLHDRPKLFRIRRCSNVNISNIKLVDSPNWTLFLDEVETANIEGIEIDTDITAQYDIIVKNTSITNKIIIWLLKTLKIPLFPLNTDGIDIVGCHVNINNVKIRNYDDVIVPKPLQSGGDFCKVDHITYYDDIRQQYITPKNCTYDINVNNVTA